MCCLLLTTFMMDLTKGCKMITKHFFIGYRNLNCLRICNIADNVAIIAHNQRELEADFMKNVLDKCGIALNLTKIKVMFIANR